MSESFSPERHASDEALFSWLKGMAKTIGYGEVGLSLVIVDGQVVRVKKTVEESRKLEPRQSSQTRGYA